MSDAPALVERLLLVTVLAVSFSFFWHRLSTVLGMIRGSRPDPGFALGPLGPRVAEFVSEVLLQSKVIRHRPVPGLLHALVFWGFCAFALVTLNHFASGFGLPLFGAGGWFAEGYRALAALFAVAVGAAISGLAFRRFVVRPKWLGDKTSAESGLIALLIFVLMATYLAEYLGNHSRAVWWLHTAAFAVMLPLIPHSKHLHLLLSPAAVFLGRGGFSAIPPLEGDEDFGLDTGKDVTQLAALQAFSCVECGRCTEHCPANLTGKELSPKQVILGFRSFLNAHGAGSEEPLLGPHLSQEAIFQCTTCGSCEYQCPVGVEHLPLIVGLRRGAVNTGKWEDNFGTKAFLNLERYGNPLGFASSEREKFIQRAGLPIYDGSQEYCLWLGCMGSYDPRGREIVESLTKVLNHLGITYGVLKKEKCTGDSARRLGNDLAFGTLAEENLASMEAAGVKKLLSICPHCVRTISTDWKEYGEAPPVEHHSQFLARHRDKLGAGRGSGDVVYHDPCYLGRYQGIYDEPRAVAGLAGKVLEAERSRDRSFCCGAGGGLAFLGEEKGKRVSVERAEQLAATGASAVAAACPFCSTMFRDALSAVPNPPKLLDIAEIAAANLHESVK